MGDYEKVSQRCSDGRYVFREKGVSKVMEGDGGWVSMKKGVPKVL